MVFVNRQIIVILSFCWINLNDALLSDFPDVSIQEPDIVTEESRGDGKSGADYRPAQKSLLMNKNYLQQSSILFGLTQIATGDYLSPTCSRHLKELGKAILQKDIWAIKVLDSSGSKNSGFIWGHNYWFGSKDGCETIQKTTELTLSPRYDRIMKMGLIHELAPYEMDYRVIYIQHNSPWQVEIKLMSERIIHVGLCLPKSCSNTEVMKLTQNYLESDLLEANIYEINPKVIHIKDLKLKDEFFNKTSLKILVAVLIFTVTLTLLAMCLNSAQIEESNVYKRKKDVKSSNDETRNEISARRKGGNEKREYHTICRLVECFDLKKNARWLFTLKKTPANIIPLLDGLRSVSCWWISLAHVLWYMYFSVNNKVFLILFGEHVLFGFIFTAALLVDVFFTISGFLTAYHFFANTANYQQISTTSLLSNLKKFVAIIFHRYVRLAPMFLIVTATVELFTAYIEDVSLFHIIERYDRTCSAYWWRNVLLVQNFFRQEELCLNWSWHLACEIQFFVIGLASLFLYTRYSRAIKIICLVGLLSSTLWTVYIGLDMQYVFSFDVLYHTVDKMYITPFTRITPYLLGSGTGWFLATSKNKFKMNPIYERCAWNAVILIFCSSFFVVLKKDMSTLPAACLAALGRIAYSCAICWMILGSATERGVWWSRFLESKIFQHFSRLTYATYLLNPFVITVVFSSLSASTHADLIMLIVHAMGIMVLVYICSVIFTLGFEIPYCNFSRLLLKRQIKRM